MHKIIIVIICLLFGTLAAQTPAYAWSGRIGADSTDAPNALITDAVGNVYTTGFCSGTVDFDPGPGTYTLAPPGGTVIPWASDIFISKMNASGNLVWAKRVGNSLSYLFGSTGITISVDAASNVIVSGLFIGSVDFDPGPGVFNLSTSTNSNSRAIFILKLDVNGNFVWAKVLSGGGYSGQTFSTVVDASGNLYATGVFNGIIDMDPGPGVVTFTSNTSAENSFILKLDGAGNFIFAKQLKTVGFSIAGAEAYGITLDAVGDIYTTGGFGGVVDFDPGPGSYTLTATFNSSFILKLDANGNFMWAEKFADGALYNTSLLVNDGNYLFIAGTFYGSADFDPGPGSFSLTAVSNSTTFGAPHNAYILKIDLSGNFVWAKSLASTDVSYGNSIALDAASNIYVLGTFGGIVDFDPSPGVFNIASNGGIDSFVLKLDASGNFIWAGTMGGAMDDWGVSLDVDAASDIYATGYFSSTADFDTGAGISTLSSAGKEDIFIAKWTQCAAALPPVDLTPTQNKIICENTAASLFAYCPDAIFWYGSPTSTLSLGTGTNYITVPLAIGDYTYYAADPVCNSVSRTAVTLTVDACTAIRSITGNETDFLNVYPVPSRDGLLTLSIGNFANDMNFEIYNSLGERVLQQKLLAEITELDLSDQPPGVYMIKLLSNNRQVANRKIVRQ